MESAQNVEFVQKAESEQKVEICTTGANQHKKESAQKAESVQARKQIFHAST